ncbi:MAG TPA: hypothetical protein VFQ61_13605 [Polyangiaceae bacterium]|nr:hypothetical protein [Polyangiaceae bacterium]
MRRASSTILLALALGACDATVEPIHVRSGCPARPNHEANTLARADIIDDFEDEDLDLLVANGRDGSWIVGWDMTSERPLTEGASTCAASGRAAGHFSASGFTDWGANWTAVLRRESNGRAVPYDASDYSGISFWAAVGADAPVLTNLPVGVTTMDVAWNGGVCSGTCMDYYRTTISVTRDWQRFVVRFEALAQRGFGDPLTALKRDQLVGFIVWPDRAFDLWLDDVRFER